MRLWPLLVLTLLLAGCTQATPASGPTATRVDVSDLNTTGEPSLGTDDAPVTMVAFTDLQCPRCRQHDAWVLPRIREQLIRTGLVQYISKDNPIPHLDHPQATHMAQAGHCAHQQDRYWEYHEAIMAVQTNMTASGIAYPDDSAVHGAVASTGADMTAYEDCMDSIGDTEYQQDQAELGQLLIQRDDGDQSLVPSFVIYRTGTDHGVQLFGVQTYETIESTVKAVLLGGTVPQPMMTP